MSFGFTATYLALWALVIFQSLLILALLRQMGEIRKRIDEGGLPVDDRLPTGVPAPELAGADLRTGEPVGLRSLDGRGGVLLFLSPVCTVCKGLAEGLSRRGGEESVPVIAICQGEEEACSQFASRLGPHIPLLVDEDFALGTRYRISGSPTAVVLDGETAVRAYGHPREATDLDFLVKRALAGEAPPSTEPSSATTGAGESMRVN